MEHSTQSSLAAAGAEWGLLTAFIGTWTGSGKGSYPTIEPFQYEETLQFSFDHDRAVVHYIQQGIVQNPGKSSHLESGIIKVLDNGSIQISNAQNSGRVEVLRGNIYKVGGETVIEVFSTVLDNDPRMVQSRRNFHLSGDQLGYEVAMATTTTETPELQFHLSAALTRE